MSMVLAGQQTLGYMSGLGEFADFDQATNALKSMLKRFFPPAELSVSRSTTTWLVLAAERIRNIARGVRGYGADQREAAHAARDSSVVMAGLFDALASTASHDMARGLRARGGLGAAFTRDDQPNYQPMYLQAGMSDPEKRAIVAAWFNWAFDSIGRGLVSVPWAVAVAEVFTRGPQTPGGFVMPRFMAPFRVQFLETEHPELWASWNIFKHGSGMNDVVRRAIGFSSAAYQRSAAAFERADQILGGVSRTLSYASGYEAIERAQRAYDRFVANRAVAVSQINGMRAAFRAPEVRRNNPELYQRYLQARDAFIQLDERCHRSLHPIGLWPDNVPYEARAVPAPESGIELSPAAQQTITDQGGKGDSKGGGLKGLDGWMTLGYVGLGVVGLGLFVWLAEIIADFVTSYRTEEGFRQALAVSERGMAAAREDVERAAMAAERAGSPGEAARIRAEGARRLAAYAGGVVEARVAVDAAKNDPDAGSPGWTGWLLDQLGITPTTGMLVGGAAGVGLLLLYLMGKSGKGG